MADRGDLRLRNRLVEHYVPLVRRVATPIAKRMRLRDRENAVGEVLAALVAFMVPAYDGHSGFEGWAYTCIVRKLINQQRRERRARIRPAGRPRRSTKLDLLTEREEHGCDLKFVELTAELCDRQSLVLWLRYYRGMLVKEVAALLKISPASVKCATRAALAALQRQFANCPWDELPG